MNKIFSALRKSSESSLFLRALKKISDFLHSKICTSKTAQLLTSFDAVENSLNNSVAIGTANKLKPRKKNVIDIKNTISRKLEGSFFYTSIKKIIDKLLGTKLRVYGIFLLLFGIFATGMGLLDRFVIAPKDKDASLIVQGALVLILSIPFITSKAELCVALFDCKIIKPIVAFFGYKKEDVIKKPVEDNMILPILLGVVLGILSITVPPLIYLIAVLAFVYVLMVLHKPEISVIVTVATIPFLPTMVICGEIIFTFCAYIFKVIRGKRSFRVDALDIFVLIFAIFMFLGGVISVKPSSSLPPACVFVCFISSYFLVVNLIKTKELLYKLIGLSLISFTLCSLYGIYQNYFAAPNATWTDEDMFSSIATRVVSTFENPNVFGEYLIMLLPMAIVFLILSKTLVSRSANLISVAAAALALIFTWSRGAWLGCLCSMVIFLVIVNKRALSVYVLGVFALPFMIPFLPDTIVSRFASIGDMTDSSTSYRVYIWEAAFTMIKDFWATGIGIGTDAFQTVYIGYALAGIEAAPHSHNLYLQIVIEIGIPGLAVFLTVIFMYFAKLFTFIKLSPQKEGKLIAGAAACGLLAILAQGLTDYVWYNYRVFAVFWILLAIGSAAVNLYKTEDKTQEDIMRGDLSE